MSVHLNLIAVESAANPAVFARAIDQRDID